MSVKFYTAPGATGDDPAEDKLLRAHEAEADKRGAEFGNYGAVTGENYIMSKTSKGRLATTIDPTTMQISHQWETYEEKRRNELRLQREAREHFGMSVADDVMWNLKRFREVYADLTELASIWEAIDRCGGRMSPDEGNETAARS